MTGNRYPLVATRVRTQGQRPMAIDDAAWRSRVIALASTGMSRRGVALKSGVSRTTLFQYLERGRAEPDVEPYGSFAVDYLMAERGLESAISSVEAMRVQHLVEQMREVLAWQELEEKPVREVVGEDGEVKLVEQSPPKAPSSSDFEWLLRVKQSRWPEDHGSSAHHREPELEPSGEAWLERTGMNHAQLTHMLRQPPEPVQKALVEAADDVYALLLASGWQPKEAK